ncbi:hypothetical protein KVR01_003211 [Diaporthe batatas]|uniref:uncharacterized protein n=1 Tax=Diaporthe batatas TaxID=748121 RepID=UPI001D05B772|nr:uncharacterized protein KVR01_003211 [Diaporthe batatas]KAG8167522.1 hypothetical protein KVR01_003211 [Diaporthe batatas]
MSEAEHIHPGGVPAPAQPYDKVPAHGPINFRRLVHNPENREQGNPQDGVSTRENTTAPEQGTSKEEPEVEEVRGYKYANISNISHHEDTRVHVEDLSDMNVDPQLEQETHDLLQEVLTFDVTEKPAYSRSQSLENVTTEQFTTPSPFGDLRVCRKTYNYIDVRKKGHKQYSQSATAKRIEKIARDRAGPAPSRAQEEYVARRILATNGSVLPKGRQREKWKILLNQAHEELHLHRDDDTYQADLTNEMNGAKPADCTITQENVEDVKNNLPKRTASNPFDQFQVDGEAAKARELIEGYDIIICRDMGSRLIIGVFTKAPEALRHPTNQAIHLARFPNKDVNSEQCEQPHFAVCGVEHYGVHHESGSASGLQRLCLQDFTVKSRDRLDAVINSSAWTDEKPKLVTGVYGTATKVSRVSFKSWDPELYEEALTVRQNLPEVLQVKLAKTGDNPYGYMAHLVDAQTEGHLDSTDWEQGLAALTCFGNFTDGDLVLPWLGLRISFPSGSSCHLRGREIYHYVTGYQGHRYCVVLTNKESVRKTIPDFQKGYKEMMEKVEELKKTNVDDWSEDERKLMEANLEGKSAVLELIWNSARKYRQPSTSDKAHSGQGSQSEQDNSGEPPLKKQRMSESQ